MRLVQAAGLQRTEALRPNLGQSLYIQGVAGHTFWYIGIDESHMWLCAAAFGAIWLLVDWLRKAQVNYAFVAMEVVFVVGSLFPIGFPAFMFIAVIPVAIASYFGQRRAKPGWKRGEKSVSVVLCVGACAVGLSVAALMLQRMRREVTIGSFTVEDTGTYGGRDLNSLHRENVNATVLSSSHPSAYDWFVGFSDFWCIYNPLPEHYTQQEVKKEVKSWVNLSASDVFVDSSGHFYHGDDVARIIVKWAGVKPVRQIVAR